MIVRERRKVSSLSITKKLSLFLILLLIYVSGDDVLAERINHISGQLPVEDLRNALVKTVQKRISQLRLLHGEMIPSQ
jgi:type II secretory pathway component PulM